MKGIPYFNSTPSHLVNESGIWHEKSDLQGRDEVDNVAGCLGTQAVTGKPVRPAWDIHNGYPVFDA